LLTSATEAVVLVWVLAVTPKDLRGAASPSIVVKVMVAAIPAASSLWLLRDWSIFIGVPIAGILYVGGALALGVVPAEDIQALRNRFRASRPAPREAVSESRVA